MRILIYGAGAVGSVLGGFLASAGQEVVLLGRSWHLDAIEKQGLVIAGIWGNRTVQGLSLARNLAQLDKPKAFDWVFVCVKSHQTAAVAKTVPQMLGPQSLVCAFQNGLGNEEALREFVPQEKLALGRVIFGAEIEPGRVTVTVNADDVRIGSSSAQFPNPRLIELVEAFQKSGLPAQSTGKIQTVLWMKVLYNSALNGLSTLFDVPYGKLLDEAITRQLMEKIVDEAYQVAKARKVVLEPDNAQSYLQLLFTQLIPSTAGHHSSMLQDLKRERLTEIDALNGAIARLGAAAGVPTPINALITRLVHAQERFLSCS